MVKYKVLDKARLLLISLLVPLILIGCSYNSEYGLRDIDSKDLSLLVDENNDALIYVGRPTCDECTEFEPILQEAINDRFFVYYYNTDNRRQDAEYLELLKKLSVDHVPILIHIKGGEIVSSIDSAKEVGEIQAFLDRID